MFASREKAEAFAKKAAKAPFVTKVTVFADQDGNPGCHSEVLREVRVEK